MRNVTLTILVTDLSGYTARQARSSRAQQASDLQRFGALLRPTFAAFGGDVVKTMGDAFLVAFDSPTNAVLAAIQVQKQLELANRSLPSDEAPMWVRTGIATGEVARDDEGDVFGDAVNLAARLQGSAEPSAIWLSETTFLAMNKNEVQAFEVGARVFKGVPGEVKVYRVLDDCVASAPALSRAELERRVAPLEEARAPRRHLRAVALALLLVAAAVYLGRDSFVDHSPPLSAEERFRADPGDLASGDAWMDEVALRLYRASEGEVQALYREGTLERLLTEHHAALRERPAFTRVQLVWGMVSAPLQAGLAEAVLAGVQRHRELQEDARFATLLRDTVDYALRDDERHAAYARALAALEAR